MPGAEAAPVRSSAWCSSATQVSRRTGPGRRASDGADDPRPRRVLGRRPPPARRAMRAVPRDARDRRAGEASRSSAPTHGTASSPSSTPTARASPAPFKHVGLRVSDLRRRGRCCRPATRRRLELGEGMRVRLVEAPTDVEYDLDHVALLSPDPARTAAAFERLRLAARLARPGRGRRRRLVFVHGEPAPTERPLLNHLGLLVDSAERAPPSRPSARDRGRVVRRRREHLRRLPARRPTTSASSTSSTSRRSRSPDVTLVVAGAGHGRALRGGARDRAGRAVRRLREGDARRRLDGALLGRRLAAPALRGLPPRVPRRRSGASAARLGAARRRARLARLARRAGRRRGDRQPADDRRALRPGGARGRAGRALPPDALRLGTPLPARSDGPTLLATGGFAASPELVARHIRPAAPLRLRGNPWSTGDGLEQALARGAALGPGWTSSTAATCRTPRGARPTTSPAAQLYARHARIFDERGEEFFRAGDVSWSETNVVQATARRPGARAYYLLDERGARAPRARADGARARRRGAGRGARAGSTDCRSPRRPERSPPCASSPRSRTRSAACGSTRAARVLDGDGAPIHGLFAAGVDAGGIATGGYSSGLAQALVLGLAAAESALA